MESKKEIDLCRIEWRERPIVRVLGTVMTRDDTLGGWVPYMNGGQSKVGIHESMDGRRYRIYGWRVNDKKVTLDCFIKRHMVFHETIGTFHHWKIDDRKMGLTFYTPAEARSFDRGVRVALERLDRVAESTCSSASSVCSRYSDDHHSCHTSPISSTGSSSSCCLGNMANTKPQPGKKIPSTSSASSSSSHRSTRQRKLSNTRTGYSRCTANNSTSSSASTQMIQNSSAIPTVKAAPTLSLLSKTTSPRFCDTLQSCDQAPYWWQNFSTVSSLLNRPMAKESLQSEVPTHSLSTPHSPTSTLHQEAEPGNAQKEASFKSEVDQQTVPEFVKAHNAASLQNQPERPDNRRQAHGHRRYDHQQTSRTRFYRNTKTPYLDILERQRDLKPTEPNSYVLFSSKPATVTGSQRGTGTNLSPGITTSLSSMHTNEYKGLGHMSITDGYRYPPLLSTVCNELPFQYHPSGNNSSRFFNQTGMFHSNNIDTIKDEAVLYEPRCSLLMTPNKSLTCKNSVNEEGTATDNGCASRNCPLCFPFRFNHERNDVSKAYKEDLAERSKCRHCHEMFNHERNKPGSCRDAPDKSLKCIDKVTCLFCANSLFYHCCRDDEGDYDDEPCACSHAHSGSRSKFWRRWGTLAVLSIFLPCLCLYPPLRACHSCGIACHCCGGKHQASASRSSGKQSQGKQ